MLHATFKGKGKLYTRYLGHRDGEERKVHEEDEITSTVLGPLDFMAPADAHRFWRRVLVTAGHAEFLPNEPPERVDFRFWHRYEATSKSSFIEPDMVVRMHWSGGHYRILLIELKWRAPLSGDDQLHRQWQYCLAGTEHAQALHLFIAPEVSAGAQAPYNDKAGGDVWKNGDGGSRLVLLPWLHIRSVLGEMEEEHSPLGRWAKVANRFLKKLQIRKFRGFDGFKADIQFPELLPKAIFWQPPAWWSGLRSAPALPAGIPDHIFFTHS